MADQFVSGSAFEGQSEGPHPAHVVSRMSEPHTALEKTRSDAGVPSSRGDASETTPRSKLPLSPEQRQRLLDQLANGARNAELAAEFGLAPRQVQGIRISQARITKLGRGQEASAPRHPESVEEVVRFLRQQDDVVVREDNGKFLINGRFRLGLEQLVERANRMRTRQGKPEFQVLKAEPVRHGPALVSVTANLPEQGAS